jgi:hypothetical protein
VDKCLELEHLIEKTPDLTCTAVAPSWDANLSELGLQEAEGNKARGTLNICINKLPFKKTRVSELYIDLHVGKVSRLRG